MRSIKTLCLSVVLAFIFVSSAYAAGPVRLRFANFPAAATFPCVAMEEWAKTVTERTKGAVAVETFPGGTLLDAKSMLRGVMQGQADIGCISLAYHPGAFPFMSAFELPLGFSSAEEVSRVMWQIYTQHRPKEMEKIQVIALYSCAPSQIMSSRPVKTMADLKGLTLRASGILADVAASVGASPISMPQSDAPEALQKGVVAGVFSSYDVLKDYNFAESCRFGLSVDGPVYPFMVFMNKKKWDSLPEEVRQVIMAYAPEHSEWTGKYVDAHGKEAVAWAEKTYGFALTEMSAEEKRAFRETAAPVIDAWTKKAEAKGIDAQTLLAAVRAAKKNQ
ncbi:MAG: Solute-binding protein [Desulfovibrio sp.]